jgi:DNA-binding NtrC family response regulator
MGQILIIQDDEKVGAALGADHTVVRASGVEDLRRAIHSQTFQAAILIREGMGETETVLSALHQMDPDLAVILVTANPGADRSEEADERVSQVVLRPLTPEALRLAVRRATRQTNLARENRALRSQVERGQNSGVETHHNGNGAEGARSEWIASLPPRFDLRELLSSVEKGVIQRTLEATRGAQAEAARRLGLSRSDLSYKLAKYELRKPANIRSN